MDQLLALSVAVPLVVAAALVGVRPLLSGHRRVLDAVAVLTSASVAVMLLGSVNETWLHGRARHLRTVGVLFTLASLGLADLPPFGTFLGKGWISGTGGTHGKAWLTAVFTLCTTLVGGAVLRVAGGVFYGLGDPPTEYRRMARGANEASA